MLLITYLNPAALTGKAGRMPNDAFIVKENYTAEGGVRCKHGHVQQGRLQPSPQRLVLAEGLG